MGAPPLAVPTLTRRGQAGLSWRSFYIFLNLNWSRKSRVNNRFANRIKIRECQKGLKSKSPRERFRSNNRSTIKLRVNTTHSRSCSISWYVSVFTLSSKPQPFTTRCNSNVTLLTQCPGPVLRGRGGANWALAPRVPLASKDLKGFGAKLQEIKP